LLTANPQPMKTLLPRGARPGPGLVPVRARSASVRPGKQPRCPLETDPSGGAPAGPPLYSRCDPTEFIGVPSSEPPCSRCRVPGTPHPSAVKSPPQEALSPERVSCDRPASNQGHRREAPYRRGPAPDLPNVEKASQPFRRGRCVRHYPLTRQRVATASPRAPPGSAPASRRRHPRLSTQAPLPNSSISSTWGTSPTHRRPGRPLEPFPR
jgi:hypothetical protein